MSDKQKNKLIPKLRFPEFKDSGKWKEMAIEKVCEKPFSGGTPSSANKKYYGGNIPFIRSAEINKETTELYITELGLKNSSAKMVKKGDVLVAMYGANSGDVAICKINGAINQAILCLRSKSNNEFLSQYLAYKKEWIRAKYLQGGQGNLSSDIIKTIELLFPSPQEQQKIASFLSNLDKLIEAHKKKLDLLKRHKKGLMQNLFPQEGEKVPKLRFPEFKNSGEWVEKKLGDFIEERNEVSNNNNSLYSLTIEDGIIPKKDRYERSFLVKDEKEAYKKVYPNDFAYNPMNLRFGAIFQYKGKEVIALSKYYNIFSCKNTMDPNFCDFYLKSNPMIVLYNNIATGSLIEKRRVHFSEFRKIKIPFPSFSEQQKIGSFLSSLDELIKVEEKKIELLEKHKKGLMQGLFPNIDE